MDKQALARRVADESGWHPNDYTDWGISGNAIHKEIEQACLAYHQALIDEGYAIVPREPTEAMLDAMYDAKKTRGAHAWLREVYKAIIQSNEQGEG